MIPPIAGRFVAGESEAEALDHARRANETGVRVILNLLGEHYTRRTDADADAAAYLQLIRDVADTDLDVCLSVKPSQLGLSVSEAAFRENYRRVVESAADNGVFVWCDMEGSSTTDATIDAYEDLAREYDGVGLCLQANLKRTPADLERLAPLPGKLRLVKGAYDEPADIAHREKAAVDEAYREGLAYLFETRTEGVAVGSHDPAMVDYAATLHAEHGTDYEVQMLMGVREDAQRDLAASGVEVWQYAPYGGKWFAYFTRRIRERRANALFALRAVTGL